jgi:hypothetical protein
MSEAPTSLQTGTTPNPTPSNAQDFSDSSDDILDNFAEGPLPGDPPPTEDTHDDGTPMGLGGENGKQVAPEDSTLEADLTKQPGETDPPEDTATPESVEEKGETDSETVPESEEEPTPEFPPALLQMANLPDAEAAKAAGFNDPNALFAAVRWQSQSFARSPSERPPERQQPPQQQEVEQFQLPSEKMRCWMKICRMCCVR